MATFQFELVSPEKILFSGQVDQVDVPGSEGDFGVFAYHAPFIAALRPGIITIYVEGKQEKMVVLGGLAEISPAGLTVLAGVAASMDELDRAIIAAQIKEAEKRTAEMEQGSLLDRQIARLDQLKSLDYHLSGTAMH